MFGKSKAENQADNIQRAFRAFFESIDPKHNADSRKELSQIKNALAQHGEWTEDYEWRISTWLQTSIAPDGKEGEPEWLRVTMECDGQAFSCRCPTIERAFAFYKFYSHIISNQFHSVGPPWMG